MTRDELIAEAKRLIDALASTPRFAGSAEEKRAREMCAAELRRAGFTPAEKEFEFSEWPGRWGIPLISAWLLSCILVIAFASRVAPPGTAMGAGVVLLVAGSVFSAGRRDRATARMKWQRSTSANLEVRRGAPRVWLAAHVDSKSQTVPMLLRVASHVALLVVFAAALVACFVATLRRAPLSHPDWLTWGGLLAALPGLFCFVGNKSRGALDNASGVAAVLLASRLIPRELPLGILITRGEELDLAGARSWAATAPAGALMINCDTIDDEGGWRCMYASAPNEISAGAGKAAKKLGLPLRMGRMIPGIITDSLAFEKAGLPSVTISRGTLQTLARLHTRGDNPDRLTGAGAAEAARLLAEMVEELS
jgi:hypothetical protein